MKPQTVLIAANALATLVRFVLMRAWVFNPRRTGPNPNAENQI